MPHHLQLTVSLLTRTPATLNALLRDLPDAWTMCNEGPGTWTAFDVIGHLNHCERTDWIPRVHMILQSGESHTFPPLNREGHAQEIQGQSLSQLLDEFTRLRSKNLDTLRTLSLSPEDLQRRGLHPAFGPVTLSELLATWATHDLTHLHQLSRILAHQYRQAVGPWNAYLGVLRCNGHST